MESIGTDDEEDTTPTREQPQMNGNPGAESIAKSTFESSNIVEPRNTSELMNILNLGTIETLLSFGTYSR